MDCKRVFLSEKEIPTAWYNLQADLPKPVPPPLAPGHDAAHRPGRLGADLCQGTDRPGGEPGAMDRDSRGGAEGLRHLAAVAAGAGDEPGEGPEDARPHLLQGRKPQPAGQPQTQYGRSPGVLQQDGRHQPPDDRNRGRPVGLVAGLRLLFLRHALQGVHGQGELSPEAVPPLDDAHLGRRGDSQPIGPNQRRPADSGRRSRIARQLGHGHQRGGRGGRHQRAHEVHAGQRAEPRDAAPER